MIMRTWFFLLLFLWGILWTGADGLRAAPTSEGITETTVQEGGSHRREGDPIANTVAFLKDAFFLVIWQENACIIRIRLKDHAC
jgi:hypothetical protein